MENNNVVSREVLKEKYGDEQVLVVPLSLLDTNSINKEGYLTDVPKSLIKDIIKNSYLIPRYLSDYNPEEVEIIPYVTIRDSAGKLLTYKRIKNGDARGNGKYSIGVGGHVNSKDIVKECFRELVEELGGFFNSHLEVLAESLLDFKGVIRCLGSDFDKDHLGLHYEVTLRYTDIGEVAEKDKMLFLGMIPEEALKTEFFDRLENWSKILLSK